MDADVSIIIPCLNESEALPHAIGTAKAALAELAKLNLTGEIIIVDNGSSDGSDLIARQADCRVVPCPDRGYGNALMVGVNRTTSPYIVMGDADGSYDFTQAVPMVQKLREGFDLCMGSRLRGKILPGAMPWKNRFIGNPLLTRVLNLFFHSGLSDVYCGLRAFTRGAFNRMKLTSPGMEFASEMVVKASLLNLKRTEVPVTLHPDRRNRGPHLKPWRDGWSGLKLLLMHSPLWLFFIPSLAMMAFGILVMLALLFTPARQMFYLGPLRLGDHWMVFAGGVFVIGYQVGIFGMISAIYHSRSHLSQNSSLLGWLVNFASLENMFILSALLVMAGVLILGYVGGKWIISHFGALYELRLMVVGTIFTVLGGQTFFAGFLFAIIYEERN